MFGKSAFSLLKKRLIVGGHAFGDSRDELVPASAASSTAPCTPGAGMKMQLAVAPVASASATDA